MFDEAWLTALESSCDPDRDDVADLANDYRRVCRELTEAETEVHRLNPITTLVGCGRCGQGVRVRNAAKGMCPGCAEAEIDRLTAELDRLRAGAEMLMISGNMAFDLADRANELRKTERAAGSRCICMRARSAKCPIHGEAEE